LCALDWPIDKKDELVQAWLLLADESWLSWLSGEKRYTSLSEQHTGWGDLVAVKITVGTLKKVCE